MELSDVRLGKGKHPHTSAPTGDRDLCIMEAVAFMAGEKWGDRPNCASPEISGFLRLWQDEMSDEDRDRLLPASVWVPRLVRSRGDDAIELRRLGLMQDWLVRVYVPAWLDLVPSLAEHAAAFRALPESPYIGGEFSSVEEDAWYAAMQAAAIGAVRGVQRGAEWAAVEPDEKRTSYFAGWHAVAASAGYAAKASATGAVTASVHAAGLASAQGTDIRPTVQNLQQSALDLLDRMLSCGQK